MSLRTMIYAMPNQSTSHMTSIPSFATSQSLSQNSTVSTTNEFINRPYNTKLLDNIK